MKPEDYNDENYVPTEEDFAPEVVDKKEELRKYIKMSSRSYMITSCALAIVFLLNAVIEMDMVVSLRYYTYPLIAAILLCPLFFGYSALIYYRIYRAETTQEMRNLVDKIGKNSIFAKAALSIVALSLMAAGGLAIMDKCHWAVALLVAIGIGVLFGGLWWLFKDNKGQLDQEIEKLENMEKE